jgi:hypothetical protein
MQLDAIMMQLDVTKYDYDATRCDIIIIGFFSNLRMPKLVSNIG